MKNRGKIFIGFIISLLLILPIIVYAQKQIIVILYKAPIRAKPDEKSEIIKEASRNALYNFEKKVMKGKWYEIRFRGDSGFNVPGYIHEKYVQEIAVPIPEEEKESRFSLEVIGSYFQPSHQSFKDIYGGGISFGGEISITLMKGISIWIGGYFFTKTGLTTFTEEETKIQITPIYVGLKFRRPEARISPYFGIGVGYFQYKETCPIGTVEEGDIGYIGQIGCIFKVIGPLFLDFKGSYNYCKVKPGDIEANLGGFQGIVGVGFEF